MPVGIMTFGGLLPHVGAIRGLVAHWPSTVLILDHFGFFRQPATGGLAGAAASSASNDEEAWTALLALAELPSVHVKLSALFRASAELPPHRDLLPRVAALLRAYGPTRLLWGTDFPFVLLGGNARTDAAATYAQASAHPHEWRSAARDRSAPAGLELLDDDAFAAIMGGNAARLFGFWPPQA